jgi:predicted transcriptional regulator
MSIHSLTDQLTTLCLQEDRLADLPELTQASIALYKCGLNVFPVPRPEEIRLKAKINSNDKELLGKIPYILNSLFYQRMHLCDQSCNQRELVSGRLCPGSKPGINFVDLFHNANIAVMTGKLSGNLGIVDCDTQDSFEIMQKEFNKRNLPYWGYFTSRGGNLLIRIMEGEINNLPKSNFNNVEIWGRHHYCILPPSVHQIGVIYTWMDGYNPINLSQSSKPLKEISVSDLDWLGVTLHSKKTINLDLYGLPEITRHISDANRRILAGSINKGERNTLLTKVIYDLAGCVKEELIQYDEAIGLLHWKADNCNPPFPHKQINSILKSALNKQDLTRSKDYYAKAISRGNNSIFYKAQAFYKSYNWQSLHGRFHLTDRSVFLALCSRLKLDGKSVFRASYREILDISNIQSLLTIRNSLLRLQKMGLISHFGSDPSGAFTYSFGEQVISTNCNTISTCNSSVTASGSEKHSLPIGNNIQDVFLKLGKVSWLIYEHLQFTPEPTITSLAKRCKLAISSTSKALNKMLELGLVNHSKSEMLYYVKEFTEGEMINFCNQLYAYGKSDQRRKIIKRDQEIHVNKKLAQARSNFIRPGSEKSTNTHGN